MFESISYTGLLVCVSGRWSPKIGDPNLTGWITVAAYLACCGLALMVVRRAGASTGRTRAFWTVMAMVMAFLAVNKQLDLQSAITAIGRCISQAQHWYEERRPFQVRVIAGLVIALFALLTVGVYLMRRDLRRNALALAGLACVSCFVAVRAVGFHHVDALINQRWLDVRLNVVFELSGLVLIALNAIAILMIGPDRLRKSDDPAGNDTSVATSGRARR